MRELVYFVASSIDGFIAAPDRGDPTESLFDIAGDHTAAIFDEWADIIPVQARQALGIDPPSQRFDTVLEGRRSFDNGLAAGIPDAYPHLRHYVFSTTLTQAPDSDVVIVPADPVAKARELKAEDSQFDIWLAGGGTLAYALLPEIDRLVVKLNPFVMGDGAPLFNGEFAPHYFDLTDSNVYKGGVTFLTYRRR